jgi:hypothetical protein
MVLAYGILANKRNIGDWEAEPYASYSGRNRFLPTQPIIVAEVFRRSKYHKKVPPKCKNWTKCLLLEWLLENPRKNLDDVNFLIKEEESFRNVLAEARKERETTSTEPTKPTKKSPWISNEPFLRLYHCLLDDAVKQAFLKKDDALTRQQLDANKSDKRAPTYAELARDLFNDEEFRPVSQGLPDLHDDFAEEIPLGLETMPITADEVKNRLADSRAKLIVVSISFSCLHYFPVFLSNTFFL